MQNTCIRFGRLTRWLPYLSCLTSRMLSFRCSSLVEPALTDIFPLANAALHISHLISAPIASKCCSLFFLVALCSSPPLLLVYYFLPFWLNAEGRGLGNTPTADAREEGRRRGKKRKEKTLRDARRLQRKQINYILWSSYASACMCSFFSAPHHEIIRC